MLLKNAVSRPMRASPCHGFGKSSLARGRFDPSVRPDRAQQGPKSLLDIRDNPGSVKVGDGCLWVDHHVPCDQLATNVIEQVFRRDRLALSLFGCGHESTY